MITDSTRNLFQFIDFMHSNIENFNQHIQVILDWKEARWQKRQCGQHYTEKLRMREIQKVVNEKWDIISEQIIEPIKSKTIELSICDLETPQSIYTNFISDIVMLLENFEEEDIIEIQKAKKQYIDFRNDINSSIISLSELIMLFRYFDEMMKHVAKFFYEDGDKSIPTIKEIPYEQIRKKSESIAIPTTNKHKESTENKAVQQKNKISSEKKEKKQINNRKENKKNTVKERTIDKDELALYFKSNFNSENPINYFDRLVEELKTDRSLKEFGQIALMIHNSKYRNNRVPRVFNKWLVIFCKCIDIKKPTYKKGRLNDPDYNLKQLFNYL